MIIVDEDKKRQADLASNASATAGSTVASSTVGSSSAPINEWPPPPAYTASDPSSSSSPSATTSDYTYPPQPALPQAAHDPQLDLLDDNTRPYSSGPSVIPPQPRHDPQPNLEPLPDPIPPLAHQNHLRIYREHQPISDTYVIDPNLRSPPGTAQKNLELETRYAPVMARVYVLEGRDLKSRVELSTKSERGRVKLAVATCPKNTRFSLTASSLSGPVEMYIPQSFVGPLTIRTRTGFVSLTSSLRSRVRVLEESSDLRQYWIGPWDEQGEEWREHETGEWRGDECVVETETSPIRVGYWEGLGSVEKFVDGLVKRIFG